MSTTSIAVQGNSSVGYAGNTLYKQILSNHSSTVLILKPAILFGLLFPASLSRSACCAIYYDRRRAGSKDESVIIAWKVGSATNSLHRVHHRIHNSTFRVRPNLHYTCSSPFPCVHRQFQHDGRRMSARAKIGISGWSLFASFDSKRALTIFGVRLDSLCSSISIRLTCL